MSDLIERQKAIDAVLELSEKMKDEMLFIDAIVDEIENLPSAEPERKTGKWIWHPEQKNIYGGKYVECSACGEKYLVQYIEDEKFCRNCGAEMTRGE